MNNKFVEKIRGITCYAYVGAWCDGKVGWVVPEFLSDNINYGGRLVDKPDFKEVGREYRHGKFYLCQITIEPLTKPLPMRKKLIINIKRKKQ